jgi:tetratricopeptide (TPR) repeat protein
VEASFSRCGLSLLLALLAWGCRLPGREGPVSEPLATCRQLSQQGVAALERGQAAEAEQLLEQAVDACPLDAEARRHYAEALWQRGEHQKAVAQLEEAVHLAGEDPVLQVRLAEMHLAMGRTASARAAAEQALDLDPKLAAAWAIRGRLNRAAGQLRPALADLHRALGYAPNDRQLLLDVAELYRELNQPQRALATLCALADTYTPGEEPQQVLHLTGLAFLALGRYEDAVESFSAAVIRDQPTAELFHRLGEAELLAGRPGAAADAAHHALALKPGHRPSCELLERIAAAGQLQARRRR